MRRRTFVRALTVGALGFPARLRRAFADASVTRGDGLADMVARARGGRPLFVIIVPDDAGLREVRADDWTRLLYRDEARLAPLEGHTVICATQSALERPGVALPRRPLVFVRVAGSSVETVDAPQKDLGAALGVLGRADRVAGARVARELRKGIAGSTWRYVSGCGATEPPDARETDEAELIGCGMGGVPHASRRFLRFYVSRSR